MSRQPDIYEVEISSSIPAARIYKAFVLDGDNLIPKVIPQAITSCQIISGDGGVGTIKLITLPEGTLKHRVDGIDEEKMTYTYNITEGDIIADVVESVSYHVEIVATPEGGSIIKNTCTFNLKGSATEAEEHLKARKEGVIALFSAIEAYLHANPNEYN